MPEVVAVVAADGPAVAALRRSHPEVDVVVAGDERSVVAAANRAWQERRCHVLVVAAPVELPDGVLGPALLALEDDPRVATVSFLCDDAEFLSLPHGDLDAGAVTSLLRETDPHVAPAPIPFAVGPAVLLSSSGFSAIGPLADGVDVDEALVDFSLRGRRRGFTSVVDPSTFCRRLSPAPALDLTKEPEATLVREYQSPLSPLTTVLRTARAKVGGLQVLIDAARLSPQEMGTQVATVALIRALARRGDVARVCVALAGELPAYAASLKDEPKVDARVVPGRDFSAFGPVDVAHRPFQPDSPTDMAACQAVAARTAITVLDLIAYQAVSYQLAPEHWITYRDWLRQSIAQADAVIAPSADVRRQIVLERLPVDDERLPVAELGTDHLTGLEPATAPTGLVEGERFLVVLGADYTHKNRDLAVRAHRELCEQRRFDGPLVMAGTPVHGSSRDLEQQARAGDQRVVVLPDVTSEERNWLLRHAALVLYPTSGEGFGLVPFEAARFGTPTAFVPFGPLAELAGDLPVMAADWSPASLAAAAARLLDDAGLARAQVEATVAAGNRWTWDATAAKLTTIYRAMLARPVAAREVVVASAPLPLPDEPDAVQQSVPYRLAARVLGLRDDLRRRLASGER
ncbi:MAG: glycosyltransferase [Acidimicrobiales bacterium]